MRNSLKNFRICVPVVLTVGLVGSDGTTTCTASNIFVTTVKGIGLDGVLLECATDSDRRPRLTAFVNTHFSNFFLCFLVRVSSVSSPARVPSAAPRSPARRAATIRFPAVDSDTPRH